MEMLAGFLTSTTSGEGMAWLHNSFKPTIKSADLEQAHPPAGGRLNMQGFRTGAEPRFLLPQLARRPD